MAQSPGSCAGTGVHHTRRIFCCERHEEEGHGAQGQAGFIADLEPVEAYQELAVAVRKEVVVQRMLRSEVRVQRLRFHIDRAGQCSQRQGIDAVSPHHRPGCLEDLALGGLMASVPTVSPGFDGGFLCHTLDLSRI